MKILIALNFAVGIALVGVVSLPDRFELFSLILGMAVMPVFLLGLPIANVVYVFQVWKRQRFKSLIPLASYCAAFLLAIVLGLTISDIILKGTPCRPDSYFDAQKKRELTEVANQVLDKRRLMALRDRFEVGTNYGELRAMRDTNQQLVVFNCYRGHAWFEYIYAPSGATNELYYVDGHPIQKNLGDGWYYRNW